MKMSSNPVTNSQQPGTQPQGKPQQPRSPMRNWLYLLLFAALLIWNIILFWPQGQPSSATIPYSTFLAQVRAGNVQQVGIRGAEIRGTFVQAVPGSVLLPPPGTPTQSAQGSVGTGTGTPA